MPPVINMPIHKKSEHAHDYAGNSIKRWRSFVTVFFTTIGLLFSDMRTVHAETLLNSILWLAASGGLTASGNAHIDTTQDDSVLHWTAWVDRWITMSATIKVLAPCKFDVDIRGIVVEGEYLLDLSQAQFDQVQPVESRNFYGHRARVLSIPNAKICMVSGHDYLNVGIDAGNCADHYNVGPAWQPREVEAVMTEIQNIRKACSAVSFNDSRHGRQVAMR